MSDYERNATRYQVYRNGGLVDDNSIEVLRIVESAGAEQLDTAELWLNPAISNVYVFEITEPPLMNDEIEIYDFNLDRVVHWGKVTQVKAEISPQSGEGFVIISRTELFHLGERIDGYYTWDPFNNDLVKVDRELVFNPLIDGIPTGNIHSAAGLGVGNANVFLDPESCRTQPARDLQGGVNQFWTLSEAVYYLLWSMNPNQQYILNPALDDLNELFDPANDIFHGIELRRGLYLAQALDEMLIPLGYHWRVDKTALTQREFAFFKRGTGGALVDVFYQARGADFDPDATNTEVVNITYDASRLANVVIVRGGFFEYEITAELGKAWPASLDNLGDDTLRKDNPNFENVKDVYRKWVLNEAGDYNQLRADDPTTSPIFYDDLNSHFDSEEIEAHFHSAPRRRKLLPTLALSKTTDDVGTVPAGRIHGIDLEYHNPLYDPEADPQTESEWLPAINWGVQLLEREAGIYIDADRVPEEILSQGSAARLRVTACLQSDFRLVGATVNAIEPPQLDAVPIVLDLPERFQYRKVTTFSKYHVAVESTARESLQRDDSAAIQTYAEYVRGLWNLMDVGGKIVLEGLDHIYEVGQRVKEIVGREVSFMAHPANNEAFPQIMAIERDIQNQSTTLHLQRVNSILRA